MIVGITFQTLDIRNKILSLSLFHASKDELRVSRAFFLVHDFSSDLYSEFDLSLIVQLEKSINIRMATIMKKVVTMGEIMLRLSTPGYQKIQQAQSFDIHYGGGEANVAIGLSQLGLNNSFVSKLPDNDLGISANQYLNRFGVETDQMVFGGDRIGIYFLEKGFSIRSSKIIYDRSGSAFAGSKVAEYDFDKIFADADWFHISGITPALNEELFQLTKKALAAAKQQGLTTSFDLNFRSSLWSFEDARRKLTELMKDVDVCIGVEPLQLLDNEGKDIKDNLPKILLLMIIKRL